MARRPSRLADALELGSRLSKEFARAYVYASMMSDTDTRVSKYQGMQQEMIQLGSMLGAEAAFIEPEILKIDKATIDKFVASEPRLKVYRLYLDDIQRRAAHTLTDAEERLLASAGVIASAPSGTYGIFSDADFPYPSVTLSDGKSVRLDSSGFSLYRAVPNREDRKKVMAEFFGVARQVPRHVRLDAQRPGAVGHLLRPRAQVQQRARGVARRAERPDIGVHAPHRRREPPPADVPPLPEAAPAHDEAPGPALLRSLRAARLVGRPELHRSTRHRPSSSSRSSRSGPSTRPGARRSFTERWTDFYPTEGKRAGAYSNGGAYDVHPFMLINYNGKYTDMSTVAHELGHTMQSYFSNKTQPFPTASYPIFVAEVASTFNEALLIDHMLKTIKDDTTKLSLLGNYLEGIKSTVFRQTQFAEFELRMHEMAEKGEPLTGEALDKLYADITKKYYGHDKGVCIVDDYIAHEWAFIPHFYRNFYVFQYATSFTASAALSEKVMAGDKAALKRYLDFLNAGGSKYPVDLLKDAGVDMTTDEPLELTMKKMNRVMDEMEKLIK